MKKSILWVIVCIILVSVAGCNTAKAQEIKREGKVFFSVKSSTSKDIKTDYIWADKEGNKYPIYLHQYTKGDKAGQYTCYVIRVSKKSGKEYKHYLPNGVEIAEQIKKEIGS